MTRPLACLPLLAAACNQLLGTAEVSRGACSPGAPFDHAGPVDGVAGELGVQSAWLSPDERTVVFSRVMVGGTVAAPVARRGDLYIAHREHLGAAFHDAVPFDELNTDDDERAASLSEDQSTLYLDRRDAPGRSRILVTHRGSPADRFAVPTPVDVGDAGDPGDPFVTPGALFYAVRRADGTASVFTADRLGGALAAPRRLDALEALPFPAVYEAPVASTDGLTLYFAAPPDRASPPDIWVASRTGGDPRFGAPRVVAELGSISADRPVWLSADRCRLYFVTNRAGRGAELWMGSRAAP